MQLKVDVHPGFVYITRLDSKGQISSEITLYPADIQYVIRGLRQLELQNQVLAISGLGVDDDDE